MAGPDEIEQNLVAYEAKHALQHQSCLGAGTQGSVFLFNDPATNKLVAVKFHDRKVSFNREVNVYLRLRELGVDEVCGHAVPSLLGFDDDLMAIEMEIVSPPFCLDFGGAYLDRPPDYSPEVWRDWEEMKSMAFEDNWPKVKKILRAFEYYDIYIADVNPGNIKFE
jgi:serine/threonine protein kinase